MVKKIILWIFVILISAQIFSFSGATSEKSGETSKKITTVVYKTAKKVVHVKKGEEKIFFKKCDRFVRKTAHFVEYLVLALAVYELLRSYNLKIGYCILISATYCLLYAITDEVHQLFVDGRSGNVKDVVIDFFGSLTGLLLRFAIFRLNKLRKMKIKQI